MTQEILPENLEKLLGSYKVQPLSVGDSQYGNLYESAEDGNRLFVTKDGEDLLDQYPNVLSSVVKRDISYIDQRQLVNNGFHADIYTLHVGDDVFAVKEYHSTGREDGIRQLSRLAQLDIAIKEGGIEGLRVPTLYFASPESLFMEYIDAPTWKELKTRRPEKEDELMKVFAESGALMFLSKQGVEGKADTSHESIIVKERTDSGMYEFILIDQ